MQRTGMGGILFWIACAFVACPKDAEADVCRIANFSAERIDETSLSVTWNLQNESACTNLTLCFNETGNQDPNNITCFSVTGSTDYQLENLGNRTMYLICMQDTSEDSQECIKATTARAPLTTLTLYVTETFETKVKIRWNASQAYDSDGYLACLNATDKDCKELIDIERNSRYYTFQNLRPFTKYTFYLCPYKKLTNDLLRGGEFNVKGHTILDEPQNLAAVEVTSTSALISWDPPPELNITLERYSINVTEKNSLDMVYQNETSESLYEVPNLKPWTTYNISVAAIDNFNRTGKIASMDLTTLPDIPGPPLDLQLTVISSYSINVSWKVPDTTNGPIDGYFVQYSERNEGSIKVEQLNITYTLLTGLKPWTDYNISVQACNIVIEECVNGTSVYNTSKTNPSEPDPVKNVTTFNISSTEARITWIKPDHVFGPLTGYNINVAVSELIYENITTNETEVLLETLHPWTDYNISVRAYNEYNNVSYFGNWTTVTIKTYPSEPNPVKDVTALSISSTEARITWVKPDHAFGPLTGYNIKVIVGEFIYKDITTNETEFLLQTLHPWTDYNISVRAYNEYNNVSYFGNWTTVTIKTYPSEPDPVKNVTALSISSTEARITWVKPDHAFGPLTGYNIKVTVGEFIYKDITTNETEFLLQTLHPWTDYNISVRAYNEYNNVLYFGNWTTVTIKTYPSEPDPVKNVTAFNISSTEARITWIKPDHVFGPLTGYGINVAGGEIPPEVIPPNETEFLLKTLHPWTDYNISVRAYNEYNNVFYFGSWSTVTIKTYPSEPDPVKNVTAFNISSTEARVTWIKPEQVFGPLTGYNVNVTVGELIYEDITTNKTEVLLESLNPWTDYNISVRAYNEYKSVSYFGSWSTVTIKTYPSEPDPVKNVSAFDISTTEARITWIEPEFVFGPLTGYNVNATGDKLIYKNITSNETEVLLDTLHPWTDYDISVRAYNEYKSVYYFGNWSTVAIRTSPSSPGPVQNFSVDCSSSNLEARFTWENPNDPKGKLEYYELHFNGTMEARAPFADMEMETVDDQTTYSKTVPLKGEYKYEFWIRGKNKDVAELGDLSEFKYCILSATVPKQPDATKIGVINATEKKETQQPFMFQPDAYTDKYGILVKASVLVGDITFKDQIKFDNVTWKDANSKQKIRFYRASPDDWNPFNSEQNYGADIMNCTFQADGFVQCILGLQSESECRSGFCNGPLRHDTTYGFLIRACTEAGCQDSIVYEFKTAALQPSPSGKSNNATAIVLGVLIPTFLIGAAIVIFRLRYRNMITKNKLAQVPGTRPVTTVVPFTLQESPAENRRVLVTQFPKYVKMKLRDSGFAFQEEYEDLKTKSPEHPDTEARKPENRFKNRFQNIFPFDHSRVILREQNGDPSSCYINANYIPGFNGPREYIATQGPLDKTVKDFWRMIVEQNVAVIVMLTLCIEGAKKKCVNYWPSDREWTNYGGVLVRTESESSFTDYVMRSFEVKQENKSKSTFVRHMHFLKWNDHGTPSTTDVLINFVKACRENVPLVKPGPIVVHCSAGVGRTGTFIALDHLMHHVHHHNEVDLFNAVLKMRNYRCKMVQTEDQYVYLHECVRDVISREILGEGETREHAQNEPIYENLQAARTPNAVNCHVKRTEL